MQIFRQTLSWVLARDRRRSWLLGFLIGMGMSACQPFFPQSSSIVPTSSPHLADCRRVDHALGTTNICGSPQRIAVLSPHILDQVLALGEQPIAYAETIALDLDRFDDPQGQIPYLGTYVTTQPINLGDRKTPSLEKLIRLQPDLILGEEWLSKAQYPLLSRIAPTLLFTDEKQGSQHWSNNIEQIGQALGRKAIAQQILTDAAGQLAATRKILAPVVATYPQVLVLSINPMMTNVEVAADSTVGYLLEQLGFELVLPQAAIGSAARWQPVSLEILPSLEADIVIVIGWDHATLYGVEDRLQAAWHRIPLLATLPAAQADRIFFVDYQLWGSITRGAITDRLLLSRLPEMLLPLVHPERTKPSG
ncbi:MAG: iron-siderophore ABC transporter substrate-binding protein [Elainella sp. Prado103]|jgi:iron complex transport system substrate-binding protein|nr:iron-siderophore ABC transporter substrate-binding protein [Elainella sp. Prado103]